MSLPFVDAGTARPLGAPVIPEPPRPGEDGRACPHCHGHEESILWENDRWIALLRDFSPLLGVMLLSRDHHDSFADLPPDLQAEFGILCARIDAAILAGTGVARVHLYRWGDGSAHFHVHFVPRPLGLLDLRWYHLPLWEDRMPRPRPDEIDAERIRLSEALGGL